MLVGPGAIMVKNKDENLLSCSDSYKVYGISETTQCPGGLIICPGVREILHVYPTWELHIAEVNLCLVIVILF